MDNLTGRKSREGPYICMTASRVFNRMLALHKPREDLEKQMSLVSAVRQALPQWPIWHGTDIWRFAFCSILQWAIQYQDAREVWALAYLERDLITQ